MATVAITLRIPADELAAIDVEACGNRTQFIRTAARDAVARARRERLDAEVGRILAEDAEENLALLSMFADMMADGFDGDE